MSERSGSVSPLRPAPLVWTSSSRPSWIGFVLVLTSPQPHTHNLSFCPLSLFPFLWSGLGRGQHKDREFREIRQEKTSACARTLILGDTCIYNSKYFFTMLCLLPEDDGKSFALEVRFFTTTTEQTTAKRLADISFAFLTFRFAYHAHTGRRVRICREVSLCVLCVRALVAEVSASVESFSKEFAQACLSLKRPHVTFFLLFALFFSLNSVVLTKSLLSYPFCLQHITCQHMCVVVSQAELTHHGKVMD